MAGRLQMGQVGDAILAPQLWHDIHDPPPNAAISAALQMSQFMAIPPFTGFPFMFAVTQSITPQREKMSGHPTPSGLESFQVYIDESGDQGFKFNPDGTGSSRWFILSAVITRSSTDIETVKLVDAVRTIIKIPTARALHFADLVHEKRLPYLEHIAKARLRVITVAVHKPSFIHPSVFYEKDRLYRYFVRYLLERVSWFCRDHRRFGEGDGTAWVTFSDRSSMSYDDLRDYMELLKGRTDVRVEWSAVKPNQICSRRHEQLRGLQIADAVASSFLCGLWPKYGVTEPRYASLLKRVTYRYKSKYWNYGVKLFPHQVLPLLDTDKCLGWLKDEYQ